MQTPTIEPQRPWQFSLRKLFVFMTAASLFVCFLVAPMIRREAHQAKREAYQARWAKLPGEVDSRASCDEEVTRLSLDSNQLTKLSPEIGKFKNLTRLSACENQLTTLPPDIGQFTELTVLWLSSNQLTLLPPEIGKLAKLMDLYLSSNDLTTLPPEIGQFTELTLLSLYSNQLTSLPPEIEKLANLTVLRLGSNQLTTLPPEIGKLTNLKELDLGYNHITGLPPDIGKLTKLTKLRLSGNPITDADMEHLKTLKALKELQLFHTIVTKEGIADLQQALPNCKIERGELVLDLYGSPVFRQYSGSWTSLPTGFKEFDDSAIRSLIIREYKRMSLQGTDLVADVGLVHCKNDSEGNSPIYCRIEIIVPENDKAFVLAELNVPLKYVDLIALQQGTESVVVPKNGAVLFQLGSHSFEYTFKRRGN